MAYNPPAFPVAAISPSDDLCFQDGMTLRDYFAGQALAGWTSHPDVKGPQSTEDAGVFHHFARQAYLMADAMLVERAKETGA